MRKLGVISFYLYIKKIASKCEKKPFHTVIQSLVRLTVGRFSKEQPIKLRNKQHLVGKTAYIQVLKLVGLQHGRATTCKVELAKEIAMLVPEY